MFGKYYPRLSIQNWFYLNSNQCSNKNAKKRKRKKIIFIIYKGFANDIKVLLSNKFEWVK